MRAKVASAREIIALTGDAAQAIAQAGKTGQVALLIDDRLDCVLAAREQGIAVDGVHVGQSDIPVEVCRKLLGPDAIVGLSARCEEMLEYVKTADMSLVDYLGIGPLHETETKRDCGRAADGSIITKSFEDLAALHAASPVPIVVGGGIMIALAFLLDDYSIDPANFGMNTPVAAFFKTVGNAAFGYMLPILAGFIAMSIADRPGLAVGFAGGVLAMNGTNFAGIAAGETTGISGGFLAAMLAGFLAGYIVQFLKKITEKLPASLNGIRPMLIYPLGGMLILGAVMCGINPVMGMINTAMTDCLNAMGGTSKVLLGAIVAGMMSIDMGGPFNKAAYVFGTAALASGNYEVMAAVMVGGMVPPIAIALSTTFCPKKWTADERRNGIVNYVMGLCFVTEGAIPYAAADPLRVLPSCVAGAAVAGALSMTFGCALRAPHGGIFVFPVVDHTALYCVALAVGSVLGAVILSLLKKNRTDAE